MTIEHANKKNGCLKETGWSNYSHSMHTFQAVDMSSPHSPTFAFASGQAPMPSSADIQTSVSAPLHYVTEPCTEPPVLYMHTPPKGVPWESCRFTPHNMPIQDARRLAHAPTLSREGFGLWHAPSAIRDFSNEAEILQVYYAEVAALACLATGARQGFVFDHLVRRKHPQQRAQSFGREQDVPSAVGRVHCDYTEASGVRRLAWVRQTKGLTQPVERYGIVNVWRSLQHPILDTPLALCDAQTVSTLDLCEAEIRYPERKGEIYLLSATKRHRWFYFSAMQGDEALVFKQYDSQVNGTSRFTPHSAFDLPEIPADAIPRASIEARCLVVY